MSVYEHQAASGIEIAKVRVGPHPTDMLWLNKPAPAEENGPTYAARVFVAAGEYKQRLLLRRAKRFAAEHA